MPILSLAVAALAAAVPASDPIVVTASRAPEPLSRVGQSISVLDAAEIRIRAERRLGELIAAQNVQALARAHPQIRTLVIQGAQHGG